jgi:hypothetical protein
MHVHVEIDLLADAVEDVAVAFFQRGANGMAVPCFKHMNKTAPGSLGDSDSRTVITAPGRAIFR